MPYGARNLWGQTIPGNVGRGYTRRVGPEYFYRRNVRRRLVGVALKPSRAVVGRSAVARVAARRAAIAYGGLAVGGAIGGYMAYRGARRFGRARKRRIARSKIGHPVKSLSKSNPCVEVGVTAKNDLNFYSQRIDSLNESGTEGQREQESANVSGWKIDYHIRNTSDEPITYNMVICSPKARGTGLMGELTTTQLQDQFFRRFGSSMGRNWSSSSGYTDLCDLPINSDVMNVLHRYTYTLGGSRDGTVSKPVVNKSTDIHIKKWIPLNRQLRYETGANVPIGAPIYIIQWAVRKFQPAGGIAQDTYKSIEKCVVYFRDTK